MLLVIDKKTNPGYVTSLCFSICKMGRIRPNVTVTSIQINVFIGLYLFIHFLKVNKPC